MESLNFSRSISVEKIFQQTEQVTPSEVMDQWISDFGHDYIAHAVWPGNFEGVVQSRQIMPSEGILRLKKWVEYEAGMQYGERNRIHLPEFSKEDLAKIKQNILTEKDLKKLNELEALLKTQQNEISDAEYKEYRVLNKRHMITYQEAVDIDTLLSQLENEAINNGSFLTKEQLERRETLSTLTSLSNEEEEEVEALYRIPENIRSEWKHEYYEKCKDSKLNENEISRWKELSPKIKLNQLEYLELKWLRRISKHGFLFKPMTYVDVLGNLHKQDYVGILTNVQGIEEELLKGRNEKVDRIFITRIAFQMHEGNPVDKYLAKKYTKAMSQNPEKITECIKKLYQARDIQFHYPKLLPEVRTLKNKIAWNYGDIVVLRGNPQKVTTGNASSLEPNVKTGEEASLLEPFMNQGEIFNLPIVQEETIILGNRKSLEPYSEKLTEMGAKFVYIDELTPEQKAFFNCPNCA